MPYRSVSRNFLLPQDLSPNLSCMLLMNGELFDGDKVTFERYLSIY